MDQETLQKRYTVQIGAFKNKSAAQAVAAPLLSLGYSVRIVPEGGYYYVYSGEFPILEEATELEGDLKSLGYQTLIKEFEQKELPQY